MQSRQMKMGTVDVERYTGPCLITTAVRPKPKPRPGVNVDSSNINESVDPTKHVSSGHHHHHHHQLPVNDPRNWAGAPLLSMAASIRKTKSGASGAGASGGLNKSWHPPPVYLPAPMMHPATSMEGYAPHTSHLQGAPLIRVPRHQSMSTFHKKNVSVHGPSSSVASRRPPYLNASSMTPTCLAPTPSPLPIPSVTEMTSVENVDGGSSSGCPSSDTCSVTSDEGLASAGSESSLPRIIKPRRRRKKNQESLRTKGLTTSESSSALSELDDLLSNQGDPLAELFRHSLINPSTSSCSMSSAGLTTDKLTAETSLWPERSSGEDDIWSSNCWHSLSPVWSPSGSSGGPSPSSSASYWPDQRVIRRPDRTFQSYSTSSSVSSTSTATAQLESTYFPEQVNDSQLHHAVQSGQHYLQVSSQLIASPFNGHRDIEIRFFSSAAQAVTNETPEHNNPAVV